ncbi:helix-turn-helix domain-containing protein [Breoghania sp.]|uniref:helix-turn-helix domain-containing protein n=1 Tax=Breoghania sp. TaxID=2065378 RepID=UPI002612B767|nr:helix-turn-helix domain-containing protein [Breoghania sp.]MDJ0932990.1 helix-turn-helix domain-containing protein [Breoghania sp.]
MRLRYGLWMLKTLSRPVTDVALEAGFADCAHFSRYFREVFGLSPSQVRKESETAGPGLTIPMRRPDKPQGPQERRFYE